MSKLFNSIPIGKMKSNMFDLSHEKKLSCNMAELVPVNCIEVIPGDKFRISSETFVRLAPLVSPMMHKVNVYMHHFFVPNRLIFDDWEDFITGGEDGLDTTVFPQIQVSEAIKSQFAKGTLADYLGVPAIDPGDTIEGVHNISALPFRAYQTIFNEYYRDQNVDEAVNIATDSSPISGLGASALTTMRTRCWERDYFTSALPTPQRGADVDLPVDSEFSPQYKDPSTVSNNPTSDAALYIDSSNDTLRAEGGPYLTVENLEDPQTIDSTSVTINDFRVAQRLQIWLEKMMRAGSRYKEQLLVMFGVRSKDARLDRPEYLGGGKSPVIISEVVNTSATATEDQGNLSGHAYSVGKSNSFVKTFDEHGYIISIMSVLPKTAYQQGLPKHFRKFDKFDFFWRDFANLGEQEINNGELKYNWEVVEATNETLFGYTPRYSEYKFQNSSVHGDFRDDFSYWHMGRIFTGPPALNADFMKADPTHRVFSVVDPTVDKLWVMIYNDIKAIRKMPFFGTPML